MGEGLYLLEAQTNGQREAPGRVMPPQTHSLLAQLDASAGGCPFEATQKGGRNGTGTFERAARDGRKQEINPFAAAGAIGCCRSQILMENYSIG